MIHSFRDAETEKLYKRIPVKRFRAIERAARIKLGFLDAAADLRDPALPGLRLKKLGGHEIYSIRINDQYRIRFAWRTDGAY